MILTKKQTVAIDLMEDETTTEVLFGGGAGGGKSALGCYWQIKRRCKYPGTRGLIGRSELKTLKETTLNTFFEVATIQNLQAGVHYFYNQQSSTIRFYNGSEILLKDLKLYPTDPNFDSLGSLEITDAFIDECNQLTEKAWSIVKSRIRYQLDQNGLIPKILGTCNPAKNYVYSRFFKPDREGTLPNGRAFVQSLLTDNLHVSRHYRANLETLDRASQERLLKGNWNYDDDPSTLISYDAIIDMYRSRPQGQPTHITADIARFGLDKTILCVWSDWQVIKWVELSGSSITNTANQIRSLMLTYRLPARAVVADDDGVGGGVVDLVGCHGFINNARPRPELVPMQGMETPNYVNLKSQCYFRLAERINRGAVGISEGVQTTEQKERTVESLEQVKQQDMDKDNKKGVVPKDKVKELLGRSPDESDVLMMREYFTLTTTSPVRVVNRAPRR